MADADLIIHVHIGAHKTGTSAIQDFCFDNAAALQDQGMLYPLEPTYIKGHHPVTWALGVPHPRSDGSLSAIDVFDDLYREAEQAGAHSLILSSEGFEFLEQPDRLRNVTGDREVRVYAYLRPQDRYVASMYNHHLRIPEWRFAGTIDQFLAERDLDSALDYGRWLSRWSATFGGDALRVRPYDAVAGNGRSVVADFCDAVGIDAAGLAGADRTVNPSLGPYESEALRVLNGMDLGRDAHLAAVRFLRWVAGRGDLVAHFGPPPPVPPPAARRAILEAYAERNRRLREDFPELGHDFGRVPETTGGDDPALPTAQELLAALAPLMFEWQTAVD